MCAINGVFAYNGAANVPERSELIATRDAMRSRGLDGLGSWWSSDRRCGFGHRRLAIVDLSDRAAQPMTSANGRLTVVFNGEIYNGPELRAELEAEGASFRTTSDTEVLLHLFARDGETMVQRLRGMFAFAIWDDWRRRLFLARDPYGIKPLYTANDGWTFRFASQVKGLLAGGKVARDAEPAGIVGFHLFGSVPEPFTLYRDIRSLPAGHIQWVDNAGPREPKPYQSIAALLADRAQENVAPTAVAARVREATAASLKAHLIADVEVGIFLSAGIDSGALLGLMRDAGQERVRAITLSFAELEGTPQDEVPLAAMVAERYGARHRIRRVTREEFEQDLPRILDAMDQPSIDGINTWFVAKAAREIGLKVAISGVGGDELFAGYPSFTELPQWRRWGGLAAAVPGLGAAARILAPMVAPGLVARKPKAVGFLEYAGSWAGAYLLRRALHLPHELSALMDADLAREGLRRLRPLARVAAAVTPDPGSDIARVAALESSNYLRNQLLRDTDWAGMAHGVEIRTPLVDAELLRQLAPLASHFANRAGKMCLAAAPTLALPPEVTARAKTGFVVPTAAWTGRLRAFRPTAMGQSAREWSRTVMAHAQALGMARLA